MALIAAWRCLAPSPSAMPTALIWPNPSACTGRRPRSAPLRVRLGPPPLPPPPLLRPSPSSSSRSSSLAASARAWPRPRPPPGEPPLGLLGRALLRLPLQSLLLGHPRRLRCFGFHRTAPPLRASPPPQLHRPLWPPGRAVPRWPNGLPPFPPDVAPPRPPARFLGFGIRFPARRRRFGQTSRPGRPSLADCCCFSGPSSSP